MRSGSVRVGGSVVVALLVCTGIAIAAIHGTVHKVPGTFTLWRFACPPAGKCVATGEGGKSGAGVGVVVPVSGGKPGKAEDVKGTTFVENVACPSKNYCLAIAYRSTGKWEFIPITDGKPGNPLASSDPLIGIGCASKASCWATGYTSSLTAAVVVHLVGTKQTVYTLTGQPASLFQTSELGTSPYCASANSCFALGVTNGPAIVSFSNGKVTSVRQVPGSGQLTGLSCVSAKSCVATGGAKGKATGGSVVPITNGKPDAVHQSQATLGSVIACKSASTCYAFGSEGTKRVVVVVSNGKPGTPQKVPNGFPSAQGAWCSSSSCVAVGSTGSGKNQTGAVYPFS